MGAVHRLNVGGVAFQSVLLNQYGMLSNLKI
jgi:hypothetical protein